MKYLLDTDICIETLRGREAVVAKLSELNPSDLAVSSITRYELMYGALKCSMKRRNTERRKVETFLEVLHELPFVGTTAEVAAGLRAELEQSGQPIGPMDTLIAATALEANLVLLTGNQREFSRVKSLRTKAF